LLKDMDFYVSVQALLAEEFWQMVEEFVEFSKLGCGSKLYKSFPQMWHHFHNLAFLKQLFRYYMNIYCLLCV